MIYFVIYLFLEVMVSVNISSKIGGFATFMELIFSAFIGVMIISNFRYTFAESMQAFMSRSISAEQFQRLNAMNLIGALLLIAPGFFSDMLGVLLQFSFFATIISKKFVNTNSENRFNQYNKGDVDVIDVEIIDDTTTK